MSDDWTRYVVRRRDPSPLGNPQFYVQVLRQPGRISPYALTTARKRATRFRKRETAEKVAKALGEMDNSSYFVQEL